MPKQMDINDSKHYDKMQCFTKAWQHYHQVRIKRTFWAPGSCGLRVVMSDQGSSRKIPPSLSISMATLKTEASDIGFDEDFKHHQTTFFSSIAIHHLAHNFSHDYHDRPLFFKGVPLRDAAWSRSARACHRLSLLWRLVPGPSH